MNKKFIIIAVVIAIAAMAMYFYLKAKKKTAAASSASPAPAPEIVPTMAAQVNPPVQSPSTIAQPVSLSQTPVVPATEYNFVNVIRDGSRGMAIIQYQPVSRQFAVGESVRILSGPYAGVHRVWHIYKGTQDGAAVNNLYLETPFKTEGTKTPGKFYQA